MILKNPTGNKIQVQILGKEYIIEPWGSIKVTPEIGQFWVEKLHGFLVLSDETPTVKEVKEEAKEVKKEVKAKK